MQCGDITIECLETGSFALDGGAMFGVVPKNLWQRAYHAPDEQNRIPMKAVTLLLRGFIGGKDRVIVVDTGNGAKFTPKLAEMYKIDSSRHTLESSLARFGVRAGDVTDVILTHLHFDHAGGATTTHPTTGELMPTFPNARYYVQKDHLRWAQYPTEKDRASFMKENFEPLLQAGVLETIEGDGALWESERTKISLRCVHGHTKALQSVMIESDEARVYFPADLMPTSAHVSIPYVMGYDNFPLTTIEEKKAILPRLYEEGWTVVFEHDAFTQAATITSGERGFTRGEALMITEWEAGEEAGRA
jgi:glyoxylase-like metal-dependent hydrolase (beta-lactamase superfamily II)